ncbi:hypothetical protein PCAR4_290154 [Paraburkholderia caribensis]|nr:hypothetical protein PCAR4_290154 [Paraburkholderia caribensis]
MAAHVGHDIAGRTTYGVAWSDPVVY